MCIEYECIWRAQLSMFSCRHYIMINSCTINVNNFYVGTCNRVCMKLFNVISLEHGKRNLK